ncbi:MAG: Hsp70 family protein [Desulfamplus sp.]|nr:Hsp70 family protein [Desulfamplus sp.]
MDKSQTDMKQTEIPNTDDAAVIGIDLGTTNSLVSFIKNSAPRIIPNERGERMTPSVVFFDDQKRAIVGFMAKNQAVLNADRTVSEVKLLMGREHIYTIQDKTYTPVDISAIILEKLKTQAEGYLGAKVDRAVITVPAYFDDRQRDDTLKAAQKAGLKVLRLLNEPTAAALTYGMSHTTGANLLVIDLGGGTFDITLMEYNDKKFRVRGVGGSTNIGGSYFDRQIVDYLLKKFQAEHGVDLSADSIALQQLVIHAERAKVDLSATDETRIIIPYITAGTKGPLHLNELLTRQQFEHLISPILDQMEEQIKATFVQADLEPDWVDTVIFVGGSTRVPAVDSLVQRLSSQSSSSSSTPPEVRRDINPDEAVARGAAIMAGILEGTIEGIEFHDITPHDLGIEDDKGNFISILPRGAAYPAEAYRFFTTTEDHQDKVVINILQQVGMTDKNLVSLGLFSLKTDPNLLEGEPQIDVTFNIDENGMLKVSALDVDTGEQREVTIDIQNQCCA